MLTWWRENSPPINVARVRFRDLASYICGLSLLVLYSATREDRFLKKVDVVDTVQEIQPDFQILNNL